MAVFADVQYCIYADIVGGSEKNYADVICIEMLPKEENTHILRNCYTKLIKMVE